MYYSDQWKIYLQNCQIDDKKDFSMDLYVQLV